MQTIMQDRINIAEVVGVQVINLDQAPVANLCRRAEEVCD